MVHSLTDTRTQGPTRQATKLPTQTHTPPAVAGHAPRAAHLHSGPTRPGVQTETATPAHVVASQGRSHIDLRVTTRDRKNTGGQRAPVSPLRGAGPSRARGGCHKHRPHGYEPRQARWTEQTERKKERKDKKRGGTRFGNKGARWTRVKISPEGGAGLQVQT